MAMTKKEREQFDAALRWAEQVAALRWTAPPVDPDVPPPSVGGVYVGGWRFNAHSATVQYAWSGAMIHGSGQPPHGNYPLNASKGSQPLYSSRERALAALRQEMERAYAKALLAIDWEIRGVTRNGESR